MNNLGYNGVARIVVGEQTFLFQNRGTRQLGLVISKALAGYNVSNDVPKFFGVQINEKGEKWVDLLNKKLPFTGITYDPISTDTSSVDYCIGKLNLSTIILSTDKLQPSVSENAILRLCVYSNDTSENGLLAEVTNQNLIKVYNDIVEGTDCIINWDMSFFNNTDKEK